MAKSKNLKFVISFGGSVICPKEIDFKLLKKFYFFIERKIKEGFKFVIVAGGGETARSYQRAISKIKKVSNEDKDWLGIEATKLNALLLKTIFKKYTHPTLFDKRFKIKNFGRYKIIIASGWKPGWSTDFVTVQIALDFKVDRAILLGKPDYVYTANPDKFKNAKPIEKMSWKDYLKMIPKKWIPGFHAPVDPIAARLAIKEKIKIIVASGKDLKNFEKILKGEKFKGTILI
jgi:uridylate kinase